MQSKTTKIMSVLDGVSELVFDLHDNEIDEC